MAPQEPFYRYTYHFGVYLSIPQVAPCELDDCHHSYTDTRGREQQCDRHGSSLGKPPALKRPGPPYNPDPFPEHRTTPEYDDGLTCMAHLSVKHSIHGCLDLGIKPELEVSTHLSVRFGGGLLDNAASGEQHWPIKGATRTPTTQQPAPTTHPYSNPVSLPGPNSQSGQENTYSPPGRSSAAQERWFVPQKTQTVTTETPEIPHFTSFWRNTTPATAPFGKNVIPPSPTIPGTPREYPIWEFLPIGHLSTFRLIG